MPSPQFDPTATGSQGLAISNLIVRLLSDYTGRGPTKARTHFSENLITIVVENLLTKGERNVIRDGKQDLVLETRRPTSRPRARTSPPESRRSPDAG